MRDLYTNYVYAVDTESKQILETANDVKDMKKKLSKKEKAGYAFPETVVYVQANIASCLIQLTTDELTGYHIIMNALRAGIVTGVDAKVVLQRLEEANLIRLVDALNVGKQEEAKEEDE